MPQLNYQKALDTLQLALDVIGAIPEIGTGSEAANMFISLLRAAKDKEPDLQKKHLIDAGLSAVAMIPFGVIIKLLKKRALMKAAVKVAKGIKTGTKHRLILRHQKLLTARALPALPVLW